MAFTQNLRCEGCHSPEDHVHLTKDQEAWLLTQEPDLTNAEIHAHWKCTKEGCRTLRHRWKNSKTYTMPPPKDD